MSAVVVSSCAYLGDVAPYFAVARRLATEGHDVTMLAPASYEPMVAGEDFAFAPYGLDMSATTMHADPEHSKLMRHPLANMPRLGPYWMARSYLDDPQACERSVRDALTEADCLVTHPALAMVTLPIATSMGVPTVIGHLFPMIMPTREWTPPIPYNFHAPRSVNRALWAAMIAGTGRAFAQREFADLRSRCGLPPRRGIGLTGFEDAAETVMLVSEVWARPASDWAPVTPGGFAIWDGPPGADVPSELDRYIDAGDPPVLITLGTSAATDAAERLAAIRRDLASRGLRSMVLAGNEANAAALAGEPGVVAFAPLTALLPRCRAAVLSGALGGVAAAVTAGVPVVVHPQLFDQFWHGRQAEQLEIGKLARRVQKVAEAVEAVVDDRCAEQARSLAIRVTEEDGPGAVADAVRRVVAGR